VAAPATEATAPAGLMGAAEIAIVPTTDAAKMASLPGQVAVER